tara:strand:- start:930 stop:1742 length:813 start_codon:yes stop_codon:yes gene_type:complete
MNNNQVIFILDLDGTIIGNCSYQSDLYNLINLHKRCNIKCNNANNLISSYKSNSKLIRPYFLYFYNKIKKNYPNSLIYIYTASEDTWAKKEIEIIEKSLNIKFSRPIFARSDCILNTNGEYKKNVSKVLDKIKKKIKNINTIRDNLIIIDNNNTFIDYNNNFLQCKTYEGTYFLDLWNNINNNFYKNKELYSYIKYLIKNNKIYKTKYKFNTNDKNLELLYKWLYKKYKKYNKINKEKDFFWKNLTDIIISNNYTKFNKDTIEYLSKNIN